MQTFHHGVLRYHAKSAPDEISIGRDPTMRVPGAHLAPASGSPMIESNHEAWQSVMDVKALLYVA
jgi:hypothetical protein